jgi:hypothetical protein
MKNFAVIENNIVTNVIFADTQEIAQNATGLICIEIEEDKSVFINDNYIDGIFTRPPLNIPAESIPVESQV